MSVFYNSWLKSLNRRGKSYNSSEARDHGEWTSGSPTAATKEAARGSSAASANAYAATGEAH